ncbi:hypothetical protein BDV28DRAFT_36442 [Aspergillus coremiiformis]|uniref:Uncharacterized protein n=1 Tax=Aspergillus coremiiformis TaxID=138285 RepID=A0A5N6Z038_9EURO|nr:hypothetical protein BDV28DRAFT_36442 [Aspergillus coremiiformis]
MLRVCALLMACLLAATVQGQACVSECSKPTCAPGSNPDTQPVGLSDAWGRGDNNTASLFRNALNAVNGRLARITPNIRGLVVEWCWVHRWIYTVRSVIPLQI